MRYYYIIIRMPEVKKMTLSIVVMWSNKNFCSLLVGIQNDTTIVEDNSAVSYKTKCRIIIQLSNYAPWHFPNQCETLHTHKAAFYHNGYN